jgi:hypothetical protein
MTLAQSFAAYLQDTLHLGEIGVDIFIGNAPSSDKAKDAVYWFLTSGGDKEVKLVTGASIKNYRLDLFYRSRDHKAVQEAMHALEETLNCADCIQLAGFEVMQAEAITFPIDNDLDDEDRKVGSLQVNIRTYKECQ